MIHNPIDEESLENMLRACGYDEIPASVEEAYSSALRMYHQAGNGPLGQIGCCILLASLGFRVKNKEQDPDEPTNWRELKPGAKVDVRRAGMWSKPENAGEFYYYVGSGLIAVKLPGVEAIQEFASHDVRLIPDDPEDEGKDNPSNVDARKQMDELNKMGRDEVGTPVPDWNDVEIGSEVVVGDERGEFVKLSRGKVVCDIDGERRNLAKKAVQLA